MRKLIPRGAWAAVMILFAIPCLSILGVGGYLFSQVYDYPSAARELPEAQRAYQERGLPWLAEDLRPRSAIHPDDDATALFLEATERAPTEFDAKRVEQILRQEPTAAEWKELLALLESVRSALDAAVKAAQRKHVHIERDWDLGPWVLFPEFASAKTTTKWLTYRAQAKSALGDWKSAATDFAAARKFGYYCGEEPTLIAKLVHIASEAIALRGIEDGAARVRRNPLALQAFFDVLEPEYPVDVLDGFRGEMFMGVALYRNPQWLGAIENNDFHRVPDVDPAKIKREGIPDDQRGRAYLARHLQHWLEMDEILRTHSGDVRRAVKEMDRAAERYESERGLSYRVNDLLSPVFSQAGDAAVKKDATLLLTRAYIKAFLFEAKHKRFPKDLDELGYKPIDPFNGEPIKYKLINGGFQFYSVGPNGKDDGGTTQSEANAKHDGENWDIVSEFPRRKRP
jgi:hypothetical protein